MNQDKNIIIFESFLGKQFSDNPRAIYEQLKKNYPNLKMYWSVERQSIDKFKDIEVKSVRRFSIKWLYLMNKAKYWVVNSRLPLWIQKPRNTIYIQTWHGTPLKRLATDMDEVHMPGTNTELYKKNFVIEANKWDYLVSPNEYSTEIFKRAFKFNKEVIETGYPRNDFLVNNNNAQKINNIKEKLSIPLDKKVILYAPTWRDNQFYGRGRYRFDLQLDLELLKKNLSDKYIILLRLHYLIAEHLDLSKHEDFIYDFTFHEDIRELYLISDLLITDYSSVFFDYGVLKRPMIFYVYDIDEYRDTLRGFYFNFEAEAPGPLVKTTHELIKQIQRSEKNWDYNEEIKLFNKRFNSLEDGQATKRVINEVFNS